MRGASGGSRPRRQQAVGDEVAHHLHGAAADGEHAGVAHHALERQPAPVAGGAMDLERLVGHLLRHLGREGLGLGRLERIREAGARVDRGAMDEQAGRVELDRHVGQLPADALEVADGPAELPPGARVGQRQLVRALGQPEGHRGGAEPLAVVGVHQLLEAVGRADQHVVPGHAAAVEVQPPLRDAAQPHGAVALADAESRRVTLDEDAADASRLPPARPCGNRRDGAATSRRR